MDECMVLPQSTLNVLRQQVETNTFTKTVDTHWNPQETDYLNLVNKLHSNLSCNVSVRDHRNRHWWQLQDDRHDVHTDDSIANEIKDLKSKLKNTKYGEKSYKSDEEDDEVIRKDISFYQGVKKHIIDWKPVRKVEIEFYMNYFKIDEYNKYFDANTNTFYQQLKEIIALRKISMDEINKNRDNPIRNIHLTLTFTPSETYIVASWDICRNSEYSDRTLSYTRHRGQITEYNIQSGKVVEFKSKNTIEIEKADAEKKALKEAEGIVGSDGMVHSFEQGHAITFKKGMRHHARYDNLYSIETTLLKEYGFQTHYSNSKKPEATSPQKVNVMEQYNKVKGNKTSTQSDGTTFNFPVYYFPHKMIAKLISHNDKTAEVDLVALPLGHGEDMMTLVLNPVRITMKMSKTKGEVVLPVILKHLAISDKYIVSGLAPDASALPEMPEGW